MLTATTRDVGYGCSVIEVEEAALATYLEIASVSDSARLERRTLASRRNLHSLEEVEAELHRHLDDLAPLDVACGCCHGRELESSSYCTCDGSAWVPGVS